MSKKVKVPAYQKKDGTYVHSYVRTDPRSKKIPEKELPGEDGEEDLSYLSGGYEEQNDDVEEEHEE
jgi:hypothetical protein